MHDKTMLLEETKNKRLPRKIKKLFDLGFFGIQAVCPNSVMPNKKQKGKKLSKKQKTMNRRISRIRVKIENSFAGVKRLRIVYQISRIRKEDFADLVFDVCCGLWNYYLEQTS